MNLPATFRGSSVQLNERQIYQWYRTAGRFGNLMLTLGAATTGGALWICDYTDPGNPTPNYTPYWGYPATSSGSWYGFDVHPEHPLVVMCRLDTGYLYLVDITTPSAPRVIYTHPMGAYGAGGAVFDGDRLYAHDHESSRLFIYDISDTNAITYVAHSLSDVGKPVYLAARNGFVFHEGAWGESVLAITDARDTNDIKRLTAAFQMPGEYGHGNYVARKITFHDEHDHLMYVYLSRGAAGSATRAGVYVYDISGLIHSPATMPVLVHTYDYGGKTARVGAGATGNGYVYVPWEKVQAGNYSHSQNWSGPATPQRQAALDVWRAYPFEERVATCFSETVGGTQHVVLGWTGTGGISSSPTPVFNGVYHAETNTLASFLLDEASTLTWNWATNYRLTASASGSGSVVAANAAGDPVGNGWVAAGQILTLVATLDGDAPFAEWAGDLEGVQIEGNSVTFTMDRERRLMATGPRRGMRIWFQ